jgi:hypothetical protein
VDDRLPADLADALKTEIDKGKLQDEYANVVRAWRILTHRAGEIARESRNNNHPVAGMEFPVPWYPAGVPFRVFIFGIGSACLLLLTLVFDVLAWFSPCLVGILYGFLLIWAIGPPLWFWYEYHYVFTNPRFGADYNTAEKLDRYKFGV